MTLSRRKKIGKRGQMTVELCIVFPIAIVIAAIVVNAATFFGYCSEFDRVARNAVRVVAASPEAHQTRSDASGRISAQIRESIDAPNVSCDVSSSVDAYGLETYKATLKYWPTLFGLGLKTSVLGVPMPALSHVSSMIVDPYTPGEIL